MSISIKASATTSRTHQGQRFGWLIKLAQAVVIVLGICSGYSMAVSHQEALKAADARKPAVSKPVRALRMASAEQSGPVVRPVTH